MKTTRIIVFGNGAQEARAVAEELAEAACSSGSYFGGSFEELKRAGSAK